MKEILLAMKGYLQQNCWLVVRESGVTFCTAFSYPLPGRDYKGSFSCSVERAWDQVEDIGGVVDELRAKFARKHESI